MELTRGIELQLSIKNDSSTVYSIRWNSDDSQLACARGNGQISIYDNAGELKQTLDCKIKESLPVSSIRWRPDKGLTKNVLSAVTSEGAIMHWHSSSGKVIYSVLLEDNQALCCDYRPDANFFAVGCKDTSIKVYDESTKQLNCELKRQGDYVGHSNRVFSVKWEDENNLFSAGWDNNIFMWDLRTGRVSKHFHGPYICGDSIDVFENRLLCADCCIDNQVKIWSISQGTLIHSETLVQNGKPFKGYTAQFSKTNRAEIFFVAGSGNYQGYFFQTYGFSTFNAINHLNKSIYCCDFGNFTSRLAIGTSDGTVNVFGLNTGLKIK